MVKVEGEIEIMENKSSEFLMVCEWLGEPYNGISFSLFIHGVFAHGELLDHKYTLGKYRSAYDYLNGLLGERKKVEFSSGEEFIRLVSYLPQDYPYMEHRVVHSYIRKKKIQKALRKT